MQDLTYALRQLVKSPGFTAVAVLTLALGIGLNTSMFSLANTFLLRPLPYPNAERLARIYGTTPESRQWAFSVPDFEAIRAADTGCESLGGFRWWGGTLSEPDRPPEPHPSLRVTPGFLPTLGVRPQLGRWFTPDDDHEHPTVIIISHALWQIRFAGDPQILGRTIRINERPNTIVGVMPPEMAAPLVFGKIDYWEPFGLTADERGYNDWIQIVARLAPGDTVAHSNTVMRTIAARIAKEHPRSGVQRSMQAVPLHASGSDDTSRNLTWLTVGLAGVVLLIACANLANLQLARATGRSRDYAIRTALGASHAQLIRPLVYESLLLALLGGVVGLYIADECNRVVGARFRFWWGVGGQDFPIDWRVLLFTGGVTLVTGLLFGTLPGWLATRTNVSTALKDSGRGSTISRTGRRFRHALVVAEFAFTLVLLSGAAFLHNGVSRFMQRDVGWKPDGLAYAAIMLPETRYSSREQHIDFFKRLRDRVAALPGVESATVTWQLPQWNYTDVRLTRIERQLGASPDQVPRTYYNGVTPGFFQTMGITLREGRDFNDRDNVIVVNESSPNANTQVAIINESMARAFWPKQSALGKRISFPDPKGELWWITIVGVVNDVQFSNNLSPPVTRFQVYRPLAQEPWPFSIVVMRTSGTPRSLLDPFRRALAEIDPQVPVAYSNTVADDTAFAMANLRLILQLLSGVALLGLFLAALGIYAVIAQVVLQRTAEIGIRLALGARIREVLWLVLGGGLRMVAVGAAIGVAGTALLALVFKRLMPEMPTANPWLVGGLTLVLMTVALLACWLPARKASQVNPADALRAE